jgi:integrase
MKVKGIGTLWQVKTKEGKPVKNSWQLVLSLGNNPINGNRERVTRHFRGNKTDARRALEEFRREIESGLRLDADTVAFGEYADQWLESRKVSGLLSGSTLQHNYYSLKHLLKYLRNIRLSDIDNTTVRSFYNAMNAEGIGASSKRHAAIILKQILEQAVNDNIILRNPCSRVEAPKAPRAGKGRALDRQGVVRLIQALDDSVINYQNKYRCDEERRFKALSNALAAWIAVSAGLRRGEVLGLAWEDIDLEEVFLHVNHSLCSKTGQLKEPKTESSNRYIALDEDTIDRLRQWKHEQAEYLFRLGIRQNGKTPVITNELGGWLDANKLNIWWRSFCKRYGFDGLRFHDLRHTHATMLVSSGLNIKAVSSRLGHSSVGITLDLYSHAQHEDDLQAALIIGELKAEKQPKSRLVINL